SREDRDLLAIFCNQVAAMIENARLFHTATYDDLTGLYRRHVFERVLAREIERSRRFKHPLVVAMIDIDHFKKVNDSYGHAAGDILLKNIAFLISQNIRKIDCLARYGGEEFILLLPETNIKPGLGINEKLRKIVGESSFYLREGDPPCRVTISIGLASWQGAGKEGTAEKLLSTADRALYQAKNSGRNRVEFLPLN
ncbi:MAG: GGDEF domain-containing protein, partial [Candidatus Aminicenantes bacterium]|nr:GGDEF domain-containing protein [Candidatus Aminicenantes bacterium]